MGGFHPQRPSAQEFVAGAVPPPPSPPPNTCVPFYRANGWFSIPAARLFASIGANFSLSCTFDDGRILLKKLPRKYTGPTEHSTLRFCRVCGFRVRVLGSCRTSRSFGDGYGSVTELPEVPGILAQAYITHRSSGRAQYMLHPYPGYCGTGLQNSQKLRVRV